MSVERVGFIGTGIMGAPMAANCIKAGFSLTVYNRTASKTEPLRALGAGVADTPADTVRGADAVLIMLTGPEACDACLFGPGGAVCDLPSNALVINMSTIPPWYAEQLAEKLGSRGLRFVSAPVGGSRIPAEKGELLILAGGKGSDVAAARPLFDAVGKRTIHCGPVPSGDQMKMVNNLFLGVLMAGLAESLRLGEKCGLAMETMYDVLQSGAMDSPVVRMKRDLFLSGEFTPQFPLKHMAKDLNFAADLARDLESGTPSASSVRNLFDLAMAAGLGEEDFAAVYKALR